MLVLLSGFTDALQNLMVLENRPLQIIMQSHGLYTVCTVEAQKERVGEKRGVGVDARMDLI